MGEIRPKPLQSQRRTSDSSAKSPLLPANRCSQGHCIAAASSSGPQHGHAGCSSADGGEAGGGGGRGHLPCRESRSRGCRNACSGAADVATKWRAGSPSYCGGGTEGGGGRGADRTGWEDHRSLHVTPRGEGGAGTRATQEVRPAPSPSLPVGDFSGLRVDLDAELTGNERCCGAECDREQCRPHHCNASWDSAPWRLAWRGEPSRSPFAAPVAATAAFDLPR
eukprot:scaffold300_cov258-Pinguiococcus_pyrenoidosus.AAC.47